MKPGFLDKVCFPELGRNLNVFKAFKRCPGCRLGIILRTFLKLLNNSKVICSYRNISLKLFSKITTDYWQWFIMSDLFKLFWSCIDMRENLVVAQLEPKLLPVQSNNRNKEIDGFLYVKKKAIVKNSNNQLIKQYGIQDIKKSQANEKNCETSVDHIFIPAR